MVLELMDSDLQRIITSSQVLTEHHFKCFMKQILEGVHALHSLGIFHRDLKPGNILLTKDCHIRIADFGLARYMHASTLQGANEIKPMTHAVVTTWYRCLELLLSPVQIPYSAAVDMWSVGCIFGELLQRKPLFKGKNHLNQIQSIFEIVGPYSYEELGFPLSSEARYYLRSRVEFHYKPFKSFLPADSATDSALELLEGLLKVNPNDRFSAAEALQTSYLSDALVFYDYAALDKRLEEEEETLTIASECYFDEEEASFEDLVQLLHEEVQEMSTGRYRRHTSPQRRHLPSKMTDSTCDEASPTAGKTRQPIEQQDETMAIPDENLYEYAEEAKEESSSQAQQQEQVQPTEKETTVEPSVNLTGMLTENSKERMLGHSSTELSHFQRHMQQQGSIFRQRRSRNVSAPRRRGSNPFASSPSVHPEVGRLSAEKEGGTSSSIERQSDSSVEQGNHETEYGDALQRHAIVPPSDCHSSATFEEIHAVRSIASEPPSHIPQNNQILEYARQLIEATSHNDALNTKREKHCRIGFLQSSSALSSFTENVAEQSADYSYDCSDPSTIQNNSADCSEQSLVHMNAHHIGLESASISISQSRPMSLCLPHSSVAITLLSQEEENDTNFGVRRHSSRDIEAIARHHHLTSRVDQPDSSNILTRKLIATLSSSSSTSKPGQIPVKKTHGEQKKNRSTSWFRGFGMIRPPETVANEDIDEVNSASFGAQTSSTTYNIASHDLANDPPPKRLHPASQQRRRHLSSSTLSSSFSTSFASSLSFYTSLWFPRNSGSFLLSQTEDTETQKEIVPKREERRSSTEDDIDADGDQQVRYTEITSLDNDDLDCLTDDLIHRYDVSTVYANKRQEKPASLFFGHVHNAADSFDVANQESISAADKAPCSSVDSSLHIETKDQIKTRKRNWLHLFLKPSMSSKEQRCLKKLPSDQIDTPLQLSSTSTVIGDHSQRFPTYL